MDQQKIGKFIQERRKNIGLTQVELAERLGISNRTISKWENGNSLPDYSIFNELCKELDISINELLSGEKLTEKNYQEKLEKNFVDTIDYNNKMRNKRIRRFIFIVIMIVLIWVLYKCFILFYYGSRYVSENVKNTFPHNKEIYSLKIKNNGLANKKFNSNWLNVYIPKDFELTTDKAKSGLVMDNCDLYMKNLFDKDNYDSAILLCNRYFDNSSNLDFYGIDSRVFPYLEPYKILEKYSIDDNVDLIKYYEKHYNDKLSIFSDSSLIKMNYIAKTYSENTLPSYSKFYYLENDLRGYLVMSVSKNHYQAIFMFGDNTYSISFFNGESNYFDYEKVIEILSSIYSI